MTRREIIELILKMKGGQATRRDVKGVRGEFDSLRGVIGGIKTALAATGIGFVIKQLYDAGVEAQRVSRSFQAITGDTKKAAAEMAWLRKNTDALGQQFYALAPAYAGYLAAAKETNLTAGQTKAIFLSVLEGATALNKGVADTEGMLLALQQMLSKGNVQAEELRGQLGERLPGAFNLAAKAMGISTQELNKMLDRGQVVADVLLPRLANALHEKYGKAALDAADDAQQGTNRFATSWKDLKATMANSGFLEEAAKGLKDLSYQLNKASTHKNAKNLGWLLGQIAGLFRQIIYVATHAEEIGQNNLIDQLTQKVAEYENRIVAAHEKLKSLGADPTLAEAFQRKIERDEKTLQALRAQLRSLQASKPLTQDLYGANAFVEAEAALPAPAAAPTKGAQQTSRLEADVKRLSVWTDRKVRELQSLWDNGLSSLKDYFGQRQDLITQQYQMEMEALKKEAALEKDPDKKLAIETEIFEREQKYKKDLIDLTDQQIKAEEDLDDKKKQFLDRLKEIQDASKDSGGTKPGSQNQFSALFGDDQRSENSKYEGEVDAIDKRYQDELKLIEDYYSNRKDLDDDYAEYTQAVADAEMEHEMALMDARLQHEQKMNDLRIKMAKQAARYLADIAYNIYVATGESNKALLDLYKAAATANVIISTAQGIMRAFGEHNYYEAIGISIFLAAMGAAQIAQINAQQLAYGGPVGGTSPGDRADNVPIWATADEYMIQRPSARYYGRRIMDAINNAMVPRDVLENILSGASIPSFKPAYALADGGPVPAAAGGSNIVVGDIHLTIQAEDAQSFADNPELVAAGLKDALRLGLLRGVL